MNKTEVIAKIAEKTGYATEVCEAVVTAFEERSGDALANKLKGARTGHTGLPAGIAESSGQPAETCERVVEALDEVLHGGLADKLRFWKRK